MYQSYCGLYCGACGTLLATEKGVADARGERCLGCKSHLLASGCQTKCPIRPCAIERGLSSCATCKDFPCESLRAFASDGVKHHSVVIENLHLLQRVGEEAWLEQQKRRFLCPSCGTRFSWKQTCCANCGTAFDSTLRGIM